MSFALEQKHIKFREEIRQFALKNLKPLAADAEETETFPKELWKIMGKSGYLGIRYPKKYGGLGEGLVANCIYIEEMNKVSAGLAAGIGLMGNVATLPIYLLGSEEQKQRWLVPALRGELVSAFGLTEPGAGSDAAGIECSARKTENCYILNGTKIFITNGGYADIVIVAAKTNPQKGAKGISLFVVEKGTPGFQGKKLKKMATRGSETAELMFDNCRVPLHNILGEEDVGFINLMKSLNEGRLACAASALGIASAAFAEALQFAKERRAFGKMIGSFQGMQFAFADMSMDLEAGRLLTYHGAWKGDQGHEYTMEAAWAKLYTSEMVKRVTSKALQVFGGRGFLRDYPMERFYREAAMWEIVEGTSEIQRIIIARGLGLR